jgi:hypothetical protein
LCTRCARLLLHVNARCVWRLHSGRSAALRTRSTRARPCSQPPFVPGALLTTPPAPTRRYTGYHGYLIAQQGLAAAARARQAERDATTAAHGSCLSAAASPSVRPRSASPPRQRSSDGGGGASRLAAPPSIDLESLGAVEEVLYGSSGALYNLSRHPGNRDTLYRLELEVRAGQGANHQTPNERLKRTMGLES